MAIENEIKRALKEGKLVMGSRSVIRAAKLGRLGSLIYASNAPGGVVKDIRYYTGMSGASAQEFPGNSVQLGELCGKPFAVLLLGITK